MDRIIIADISSFSQEDKLVGHWKQCADMYFRVLSDEYSVIIAGSKLYQKNFGDRIVLELPYSNKGLVKLRLKDKLRKVCREVKNTIKILKSDEKNIIFQSSGFTSILIAMFLMSSRLKKKNIYLIEYGYYASDGLDKILFKITKKHINGVIVSNAKTGELYGVPYCVIPDYLYIDKYGYKETVIDKKYDFAVVGTMNPSKDIKDVVQTFSDTKYNVIIAGFFRDKKYLNELRSIATSNITINDMYIDDEEYDRIIQQSRYGILPYREAYNDISSGVVYDFLFRKTPVIAKKLTAFNFIETHDLGILYSNSLSEITDKIDNINYNEKIRNISAFLQKQRLYINRLKLFLKENRRK